MAALLPVALSSACAPPPDLEAEVRRCVAGLGEPEGAGDLLGLAEDEAVEMARTRGLDVRVVGEDGGCASRTDDFREDRVNVYLVGGEVVAASIG